MLENWDQGLDEGYTSAKFAPILGTGEDSTRLYFPPIGQDFRPYVAPYNHPPDERPRTPLFIAFTRNNDMLQQVVLAWIAVGWPREDIIIVDNTGTMDANNEGMLSPKNPFFIDYPLYRKRYGVAILQTPTLLNFSQLQNFFLRLAIAQGWPYYFWSHMDIGVLGDEDAVPYQSFYSRVLDILDNATSPPPNTTITTTSSSSSSMRNTTGTWAIKLFNQDYFTLVNVAAWRHIGSWDPFIPYYNSDCDAYARATMHNHTQDAVSAGQIYDVAGQIAPTAATLEAALFPSSQLLLANASEASAQLRQFLAEAEAWGTDVSMASLPAEDRRRRRRRPRRPSPLLLDDPDNLPNSPRYQRARAVFAELQAAKRSGNRNTWQTAQGDGGRGEPWTYDPRGFQRAWWEMAGYGRDLYAKKWGPGSGCGLEGKGVGDAWAGEWATKKEEEEKKEEE